MLPKASKSDLDWLFQRQRFGIRPGLERVQRLLTLLGNPQQSFQSVLVAGTNGKGSTAVTLANILAPSTRVGLFTSPHLTHFGERFVVNGKPVPASALAQALAQVRPHAESTEATFFEIVTALGCLLFAQAGVQIAVMEVGLGGRWDATNVLQPALSIVTNVAFDHTAVLGNTLEAIAYEKAGVLRPHLPAVTGVESALRPVLEAEGADLWALGRELTVQVQSLGWEGSRFSLTAPGGQLSGSTPLLGTHGAYNAALAAAAALRLGVRTEQIEKGVAQTRWPGRLELLNYDTGKILLDGAHNPAGAVALVKTLQSLNTGPVPLIFGAAEDKDVGEVAQVLRPLASRVVLTRAVESPRAAMPEALVPYFAGLPTTVAAAPADALAAVNGESLSLACGSLYLIGELRPLLLGEVGEHWERWQ